MSIAIEPGEMRAIINDYNTDSQSVQDVISRMDSRINQLEAIWTGQASSAYVARYHEFKPGFDNMRQLIADIATALSQATDAFEQTDQAAAQSLRS